MVWYGVVCAIAGQPRPSPPTTYNTLPPFSPPLSPPARYLFLPDFYECRLGVDGSKPASVRAAEARLGAAGTSPRAWGLYRFMNYVAARAEVR